ncbi:MAG: lysine--tRNA ligase [Candidatus Calescibacterium sp.]|nr:lysine--tRNA ligase [Candidatus Calescibacterium sp.]MCX7733712.1 lysine--tRNA ligase [bacterium]MDW8087504.1 lysine--tRNA ligase [Candidatus Calescibacterium sp.]
MSDEYSIRSKKLRDLVEAGSDPYKNFYTPNTNAKEVKDKYQKIQVGEHIDTSIKVSGRLITIRDFGGSVFFHIQDHTEKIQCFLEKKQNPELLEFFKKYVDSGDIVGVEGSIFRTKKGEITIYVRSLKILAKCLHPLPEKWHGLRDVETRYRYRYLDLIMNPEVKDIFTRRSKIINFIRNFLSERGFVEVETPYLQPVPSGALAKPFKTYHNELEMNLFLRIAPELYLKRLIVGGFDRVFEIGKNFRNEGITSYHNPEFTMLELYQSYANYEDLMKLTEELLYNLCKTINGEPILKLGEKVVNFSLPLKRISIPEKVAESLGISKEELKDLKLLKEKIKGKMETDSEDWGEIVLEYFEEKIADSLDEPTFVVDFPVSTSPLAKRKSDDQDYTERFELYIFGMEVANGFSELNDPIDQRKRFEEQMKVRKTRELLEDMDWDFVKALEYGMPPTAGEGIGIDRLIMTLTGASSIKEVILFPAMKPD